MLFILDKSDPYVFHCSTEMKIFLEESFLDLDIYDYNLQYKEIFLSLQDVSNIVAFLLKLIQDVDATYKYLYKISVKRNLDNSMTYSMCEEIIEDIETLFYMFVEKLTNMITEDCGSIVSYFGDDDELDKLKKSKK